MKIKTLNKTEWNDYLADCSNATFFHTPIWYEVWNSYLMITSQCLHFSFESGNTVIFPYAVSSRVKKLFTEIVSSPAGTYGGLVSSTGIVSDEINQVFNHIFLAKNLLINTNPLDPLKPGFKTLVKDQFTQIINLKQSLRDIYKSWSKGHYSGVRKGKREGVRIEETREPDDWDNYYNLYLASVKRWKRKVKNPYRAELFNTIKNIATNNSKLWVAKFNNDIVAGALCFYFNNHVVYWHGAASKDHFKIKPVHVLIDHIIKDAMNNNFNWFDFNPSNGLNGVIKFKKGFGTTKLNCEILLKQSSCLKIASKLISLYKYRFD